MSVLVTGAAGYIGSVLSERLVESKYDVIGIDSLVTGHKSAVPEEMKLIEGDLCDLPLLDTLFTENEIDTVIHLAGSSIVSESVKNPSLYFNNNVVNGITLLDTMRRHKVNRIIFSSSAAVYGTPAHARIKEESEKVPEHPYGESKLIFEKILDFYRQAYGIQPISLRYFNAAGATKNRGEWHNPETHLIPNILLSIIEQKPVTVYGNDYDTPDGTCVRDYVHVADIADAHILAMSHFNKHKHLVFNIGNTRGYSVLEVINTCEYVTGCEIPKVYGPPRAGDPSVLVADSSSARKELGWQPEHSNLNDIISSAWRWLETNPSGYREIFRQILVR